MPLANATLSLIRELPPNRLRASARASAERAFALPSPNEVLYSIPQRNFLLRQLKPASKLLLLTLARRYALADVTQALEYLFAASIRRYKSRLRGPQMSALERALLGVSREYQAQDALAEIDPEFSLDSLHGRSTNGQFDV